MPEMISDLFQIQNRFLRSAHLERDFADPKALKGYVLTPQTQTYLERLASGLNPTSGQRAWRITGDFGTGKSSFALVTAHLLSGKSNDLPVRLRQAVSFNKLEVPQPRLLPVLVTGSREPLAVALLRSLHRSLVETCGRGRPPLVIDKIAAELSSKKNISEETVVRLLTEASAHVTSTGKGTGVLVILDELGKFLEFAALNPDRQDVFLLQRLAETASRSGKNPLFILGLLHQGFNAYADQLSQSAQKEWEKVAGRFEELIFNQPLEQTAMLVADALNLRADSLSRKLVGQARRDMTAALDMGWYGAAHTKNLLLETASRLYPLHPSVLPVLVMLFSRFGQNERSLFSFLLSNEPSGLQEFARRSVGNNEFYRIHHLYDYARSVFGHRLSVQSYRSHWNQIDSMIESFPAEDALALQILKTVGLLNMLDANNLLASEDAIKLATLGSSDAEDTRIKNILRKLQKNNRVLYYRGVAGGYCLWPHTSVNLEKAYEDASRALGQNTQRIASQLHKYLETRPLVARRHYIETGNLRHFEVQFTPVNQLSESTKFDYEATDGRIIVALCETEEERQEALKFSDNELLTNEPAILFAVPKPLSVLAKLVQELQRWEWIAANVPELNSDTFAAEEVSRQITASRQLLEQRVHAFIGLQQFTGKTELQWFRKNRSIEIGSGRELLSYLSDVCDEVYPLAPKVSNELINRRLISSAASAARMRLMEAVFSSPSKPFLGIDSTKKPPEMSIYLSLLKEGGVHKESEDSFTLVEPSVNKDVCRLRPALQRIRQILEAQVDSRVKISAIFSEMRRPPYGVRDGLSPLLLAIFAVIHEQNVAFYDNGAFMRQMDSLDLMRMTKIPEEFEIQYYKVTGLRSELFDKLVHVLGIKSSKKGRVDLLDVVRPLCVFAAQLPPYTHKTKKLSEQALAVRKSLLKASEPSTLLFRELPEVCGFAPFSANQRGDDYRVQDFVEALKNALSELRRAHPELHERMKSALVECFDLVGAYKSFQDARNALSHRAQNILIAVSEPLLKAFCMRLLDCNLPEAEWLESLGSFVCSMPPSKWTDAEADRFRHELSLLAARFQRVESINFSAGNKAQGQSAVRVAITRIDGSEVDDVIYVSKDDEEQIAEVEAQVAALLARTRRVGLAGTARAFWKALSQNLGEQP
jgi:hypothetical protein